MLDLIESATLIDMRNWVATNATALTIASLASEKRVVLQPY
jgi:hypothetical protein